MAWILLVAVRPTPEWFIRDIRSLLVDCAEKQLMLGALFLHNIIPCYYVHAHDCHKIHLRISFFDI